MKWTIEIQREDICGNYIAVFVDPQRSSRKTHTCHDLKVLLLMIESQVIYSEWTAKTSSEAA